MRKLFTTLALVFLSLTSSQAIIINFDYRYDTAGFFTTEAKTTLSAVASYYNNLIPTELSAISPSGGNSWTADFFNPIAGGGASISNLVVDINTITIFLGSLSMGSSQLGYGGAGGYSSTGNALWHDTVAYRGSAAAKAGDAVSPWGGSIAFNKTSTWNFSLAAPTVSQFDFYSVAIHEVGHVLGIGASALWEELTPGTVFLGTNATTANGGVNPPITVDKGHWASSLSSNNYYTGAVQQPALSPFIAKGERKMLTDLDTAGFQDLGWTINPVPEPTTIILMTVGISMLGLRRRTRKNLVPNR